MFKKPKDILRASRLQLLPVDNPHVKSVLSKLAKQKALSPILLIRGGDAGPPREVFACWSIRDFGGLVRRTASGTWTSPGSGWEGYPDVWADMLNEPVVHEISVSSVDNTLRCCVRAQFTARAGDSTDAVVLRA